MRSVKSRSKVNALAQNRHNSIIDQPSKHKIHYLLKLPRGLLRMTGLKLFDIPLPRIDIIIIDEQIELESFPEKKK